MYSKKSPNPNGKETGIEIPKEVVKFTLEKSHLDALKDGVETLRLDVFKIAAGLKDCKVVDLNIIEGRTRLVVEASISAVCKTAFTGAIADYKKDLKQIHRYIDEGVLDKSVAFS